MQIGEIRIPVVNCFEGVYLRWWFNGWHHFLFQNHYETHMETESMGTQVTQFFSLISKIEKPTRIKSIYSSKITLENIPVYNVAGFTGMLLAEKVEQYEDGVWREVMISRGSHVIRQETAPGYSLSFEITRKELPNSSSVYQKVQRLYVEDVLCDIDDDEVIALTKQANDIAEMQDRQSDYSAQFKIRKTREMKALFELSGDVGVNSDFPYQERSCKLILDNLEIITGGIIVINSADDQYYNISIYSGNKNFFKEIDPLKLVDLTLASTNHTWTANVQAATHASDLDYVYPLMEPSDDGGIMPLTGDNATVWGGRIWPFVKLKAIWDEIFLNAGFTCTGDILTDDRFTKAFLPIVNREISQDWINNYLYSVYWIGQATFPADTILGSVPAPVLLNGDETFRTGYYDLPLDGTYKIQMVVMGGNFWFPSQPTLTLYDASGPVGTFNYTGGNYFGNYYFEMEYTGTAADQFWIQTSQYLYYYYSVSIVSITDTAVGYSSPVEPRYYLPDMTQTDFIKAICNLFALIPETNSRDRRIHFWSFNDLYDNIPYARDWSAYLSERDDEVEFKFGDYARKNYLKFNQSDDVIKGNGDAIFVINDATLKAKQDVVQIPLSYSDEVTILDDVTVSRIGFNKYDAEDAVYEAEKDIDPRIVYVSEATGKTLTFTTEDPGGTSYLVNDPKKATSIEMSFGSQLYHYSGLSRLLTRTTLRRARFNLPVYEVAGLKHYIPIYLRQYKAYFYVNKVSNYVPGQLCTVELIRM